MTASLTGRHGDVIGDGRRARGMVTEETQFQFQVEHDLWGKLRRDWFALTTMKGTGEADDFAVRFVPDAANGR